MVFRILTLSRTGFLEIKWKFIQLNRSTVIWICLKIRCSERKEWYYQHHILTNTHNARQRQRNKELYENRHWVTASKKGCFLRRQVSDIRNSVALVREKTIPTRWLLLFGEVSANFCGKRVSCGQRDGSLRPYSRLTRLELLLFLSSSSSILLTRLSGPRSRSLLLRKSGSARNRIRTSESVGRNSAHEAKGAVQVSDRQKYGVSKRALQWYSKCCWLASVTKMFTPKGVQSNHWWTLSWTMDRLYAFKYKRFVTLDTQ
jgi:hypothetical protein